LARLLQKLEVPTGRERERKKRGDASMAGMVSNKNNSKIFDRKKRILFVVDGDASDLYYTGMLLQRLDYSIYTTRMAEEALDVMRFAVPLLILTEASLPHMSGVEFLKQIKQDPKTKSVPVIVYTASQDLSLADKCLRAGCAAYLRKPVDPDELYAAIQKATEAAPRQYARLNVCVQVIVGDEATADASAGNDCVTALSENGMYITTAKPRATGESLVITLLLGSAKIRSEGLVLYSFDNNKGPMGAPGMGIKFTWIRPEDRNLIRGFVKKELTQDIAQRENGE
jgi:CheY-like chemotaxis protein